MSKAKNNKSKPKAKSKKYPTVYESTSSEISGRVFSADVSFTIGLNQHGFAVIRYIRYDENDFGEYGIEADQEVWSGTAKTLSGLLTRAAKAIKIDKSSLLDQVYESDVAYGHEEFKSFLKREATARNSEHRDKIRDSYQDFYPQFFEWFSVRELPSYNLPFDYNLSELRIKFDAPKKSWKATLYQVDSEREIFWPGPDDGFTVDSFKEVVKIIRDEFDLVGWTRARLRSELIASDPLWEEFL